MINEEVAAYCPAKITIALIADKWKIIIIRELSETGKQRFGELMQNVKGISQKVLARGLRMLEADKLVYRHVYAEVPPRVEYSLTPIAVDLEKILDLMGDWGLKYYKKINNAEMPKALPGPCSGWHGLMGHFAKESAAEEEDKDKTD
jgi:DNA-binding HxlR family transcriptional regulator